jgi:hypothetical protein
VKLIYNDGNLEREDEEEGREMKEDRRAGKMKDDGEGGKTRAKVGRRGRGEG